MSTAGEEFAKALAAKDVNRLRAVLHPEIDFRGLTPGRFWETSNAETLITDFALGTWFEPEDVIEELVDVQTSEVGPRQRVAYRLLVTNSDGRHYVEQQAYYQSEDDRITWLRILCSGYQKLD